MNTGRACSSGCQGGRSFARGKLVDITLKFYRAEGDPAIIDAMVMAVAAVLSIDNVRLIQDDDDDILLISAGR